MAQNSAANLLTRTLPKESAGDANPVVYIPKSNAAIAITPLAKESVGIADYVLAEIFHHAGGIRYFDGKALALAAYNSRYAGEEKESLDPTANILDPAYNPGKGNDKWTERNQLGYSAYFHTTQKIHCGYNRPNGRANPR